jgi:hypothetical protein
LADKNYIVLEELTSSQGLSWNEFLDIDLTQTDIKKDDISEIPKDAKTYMFGYTDGKGDPIILTKTDYLAKYIYTHDYLLAPEVAVNKLLGGGNPSNNLLPLPGAMGRDFVSFYFSGFNPEYPGFDWTAMYLVFDLENGEYKLRGISKGHWSI